MDLCSLFLETGYDSIACISWFWVLSNCSMLALLVLLLLLLGWPLRWLFLVFTI
jgi:hypothetical protein